MEFTVQQEVKWPPQDLATRKQGLRSHAISDPQLLLKDGFHCLVGVSEVNGPEGMGDRRTAINVSPVQCEWM